jgi:hypothetical protein
VYFIIIHNTVHNLLCRITEHNLLRLCQFYADTNRIKKNFNERGKAAIEVIITTPKNTVSD